MMESIKQTSFLNLQGDVESHVEPMNGRVRTHPAQQALSLHKMDVDASMEVSPEDLYWNESVYDKMKGLFLVKLL